MGDDIAGLQVGPYRLLHLLGQGGSASVWSAKRIDRAGPEEFAVKVLHPTLLTTPLATCLRREAGFLARLSHPNVVRLLDAEIGPAGQPYLVMERIQGERIDHHCDRRWLKLPQRLMLFLQVCAAISHVHERGMVHGDLKPSNILVDTHGQAKLLDFGAARRLPGSHDSHWEASPVPACPGAMPSPTGPDCTAPEQWLGEAGSVATDVYALGVLLHWLLTGCQPTWEDSLHTPARMRYSLPHALAQQVNDSTNRRAIPEDLMPLLQKALHTKPSQRYPSVDAFGQAIRHYLDTHAPRRRSPLGWMKNVARWVGYALLLAAALGAAVGLVQALVSDACCEPAFDWSVPSVSLGHPVSLAQELGANAL